MKVPQSRLDTGGFDKRSADNPYNHLNDVKVVVQDNVGKTIEAKLFGQSVSYTVKSDEKNRLEVFETAVGGRTVALKPDEIDALLFALNNSTVVGDSVGTSRALKEFKEFVALVQISGWEVVGDAK